MALGLPWTVPNGLMMIDISKWGDRIEEQTELRSRLNVWNKRLWYDVNLQSFSSPVFVIPHFWWRVGTGKPKRTLTRLEQLGLYQACSEFDWCLESISNQYCVVASWYRNPQSSAPQSQSQLPFSLRRYYFFSTSNESHPFLEKTVHLCQIMKPFVKFQILRFYVAV